MMTRTKVILAMLLTSMVALPITPSWAGKKGRRNTALALSGVTLYHLVKGHTGEAIAFGAGSAFAWKRHSDARRHR